MKIILVSHGDLAKAFLDAAQMIIGPQEDVCVFGLYPEASLEEFEQNISKKIAEYLEQNEEVFVFTDIFFGTPFNTMVRLMNQHKVHHFTGLSLPILLELLSVKDSEDIADLGRYLVEKGQTVLIDVNSFLDKQD